MAPLISIFALILNLPAHVVRRPLAAGLVAVSTLGLAATAHGQGRHDSVPANAPGRAESKPIEVKQITSDVYFFYDNAGSNSAFLVTDEGVLVIDSRIHPRLGDELIAHIRKVTDKPIKWLITTHFHGDHHFGNSAFKAAGATLVAHKETARLMQHLQPKEIARRSAGLKKAGFDPAEVKLVLPDVTFDSEMTIRLGGREVRLMYLGPAQQEGDTFIHIPHAKVLFTTGAFARRSMPNMIFTTSIDNWIKVLETLAVMPDVEHVLPGHDEVATPADIKEVAAMISEQYSAVKEAIAQGLSADEAAKKLTFPKYKAWRNYYRLEDAIRGIYELVKDRRRAYLE